MKSLRISIANHQFVAELYNTQTANLIIDNLPFEGEVNVWGEEVYFTIPIEIDPETDAREIVEPGELGYWPEANAFCIFFGPTPVSLGHKPQAYSPVNVFGKINGELSSLKQIRANDPIVVSRSF